MKAQPAQLLAAFADAYGPGLDAARAAAAVDALLAEQARLAAVPTEDMMRTRRIENVAGPVFARALRELGVSREDLTSSEYSDPWMTERRDEVVLRLLEKGLSVRAVGRLVNREREAVRRAAARARVRRGVAVVAAEGRRAAR